MLPVSEMRELHKRAFHFPFEHCKEKGPALVLLVYESWRVGGGPFPIKLQLGSFRCGENGYA